MASNTTDNTDIATLAGGCFWCTESIFLRLKGVKTVVSGYSGGTRPNPTYQEVCSGKTGHAEAIQITFDPNVLPYEKLLEIFFHLHDPTTLNQQDYDIGPEYRSSIFYHTNSQKIIAQALKTKLNALSEYDGRIVTEITPYSNFYPAESYHQDYYAKNSYAPYCQYVIDPKIQKLLQEYQKEVKPEYIA